MKEDDELVQGWKQKLPELMVHSHKEIIWRKTDFKHFAIDFRNDNCILLRYNQEMINGHFIFGFYPNSQYLGEID